MTQDLINKLEFLLQRARDLKDVEESLAIFRRLGVMRPSDIENLRKEIVIVRKSFQKELTCLV